MSPNNETFIHYTYIYILYFTPFSTYSYDKTAVTQSRNRPVRVYAVAGAFADRNARFGRGPRENTAAAGRRYVSFAYYTRVVYTHTYCA